MSTEVSRFLALVSMACVGCATLSPDLNPLDSRNEQRLLQLPLGTSRQEVIQRVRKPDAVIYVEKDADRSCEVDVYTFQDRFVFPTRQHHYLVSFKDERLIRVVLTDTYRYPQTLQEVAERLKRSTAAQKPDSGSSDPERLHVLLSVQQEACAHLQAVSV